MPIITFENKLDPEGSDLFELLDKVEQNLARAKLHDFLRTHNLFADALLLFERCVHHRVTEPVH